LGEIVGQRTRIRERQNEVVIFWRRGNDTFIMVYLLCHLKAVSSINGPIIVELMRKPRMPAK